MIQYARKFSILFFVVCLCIGLGACGKKTPQISQEKMLSLKKASVGDIITFGTYEQNNVLSDGKEDVEWIVLKKNGNKILIISNKMLDLQPYHHANTEVTWADCDLRAWLNSDFFNTAFSGSEKTIIAKTEIFTAGVGKHLAECTTKDKVFILSKEEIIKFFPTKSSRRASATLYTKFKQAEDPDRSIASEWFSRTPSDYSGAQKFVYKDGSVDYGGASNTLKLGVRPCMWLDLDIS